METIFRLGTVSADVITEMFTPTDFVSKLASAMPGVEGWTLVVIEENPVAIQTTRVVATFNCIVYEELILENLSYLYLDDSLGIDGFFERLATADIPIGVRAAILEEKPYAMQACRSALQRMSRYQFPRTPEARQTFIAECANKENSEYLATSFMMHRMQFDEYPIQHLEQCLNG